MKKRTLFLTLLSAIMVTAFSVPAITAAFAEDPAATTEKTKIVEIFNGNAENLVLAGATFKEEGGVSVVSMETGAWADGKIMFSSPVDLSGAREKGKLYYEYKTTGEASWGKIGIVTFANYWDEGAYVGNGDSIGISENYTVKSFDLSNFTEKQLAKFKGFALGTSAKFVFKRIWVEYPNPDHVESGETTYDIFTGITEVGEPVQNSAKTAWTADYKGSVSGKAVSDGTALAFGTLEDGTYYVSGTNANTATRATIAMTDISSALLFGGVLNFKAKFDFAGADGRYAKLRLYYECGQWGEASFVEVPLTDYVAGEWKEYSVALKTLNVECAPKTTFGNDAPSTWFDWTKFVGMGISVGCAGEGNNVASFADVKITDVAAKTIVGIEAENAKTEYNSGEAFERTGLIVNVVFDDNGKVEVKNYVCNPETVVAGTDKVEISWTYNGKTYTTEVPVTVTSEYSSLVVKTQPTKAAYKAGEKFSADGMKVVAVKADNTEAEVGDYEYYKGMLAPGTTALELSYNGLKTEVSITVAQFENSLSMTGKAFDENGEPSYGWKAQVASAMYVSQATYDAASEDDKAKMCVTPKDDEKGYYISANFDSNNYATRVFEYQVADYRLGDLYEDESYNAMVAVTYRTTSAFDKPVNFGLANFMEWNLGYHNADISGYIVSDGEWHTMYFDIALSYGEIDGMLWAGISGDVDFNAIVGFAVQSQATGTLDIADVSVKWNGDANAAKAVDTTAPEFTYSGEMTITAKAGDAAPTFADQKARDKNDGYIDVTVEWQEGAVTNGKLNEGTYTVKVYAVDAAGNKTEPYNITVNVEKGETPPAPPVTPETPENSGCKGTVESLPIIITLGILAAAFLLIKRKREN